MPRPHQLRLSSPQARSYLAQLRWRHGQHLPVRCAHFAQKRPATRAAIVRQGRFLLARLQLAALCIQCFTRGLLARVALGAPAPACPTAAARRTAVRRPAPRVSTGGCKESTAAGEAEAGIGHGTSESPRVNSSEIGLISRFLEAKMRFGSDRLGAFSFEDFVRIYLQSWFRRALWVLYRATARRPLLQTAARTIQQTWRECAAMLQRRPAPLSAIGRAALSIQRAWRSHADRQIFCYFRELITFREQCDPATMLRGINPREVQMFDPALQLHVRFRLGGSSFPPALYYKIYTHGAVTDINAFAPRDYTAEFQPPPEVLHNKEKPGKRPIADTDRSGWYCRYENNGWRPVAGSVFDVASAVETTSAPIQWHHKPMQRRETLLKQRKAKKLKWMQTMYARGRSEQGDITGSVGQRGAACYASDLGASGDGKAEVDEEQELEALLQWSDTLDFDSYYQDWLGLATTARTTAALPLDLSEDS